MGVADVTGKLLPRFAEIRQLRDEIIPAPLRDVSGELKTKHLEILSNSKMTHAMASYKNFHVELDMAKPTQESRRLATLASLQNQGLLGGQAHVANAGNVHVANVGYHKTNYYHDYPPTPTNWFTIGAPVLSVLLDLMWLCLMALIQAPWKGILNRALWSIQALQMLGECLANIGYPSGVVYFAS